MDLTSLDVPEKLALRTLFELARRDHPVQPGVLARVLALEVAAVTPLLSRLEARGLVDAARVRLTLSGLAVAANAPALPEAATAWLPALADVDDERVPRACVRMPLRLVGAERGSHR